MDAGVGDRDPVERGVELSVAAAVEAVALDPARACLKRSDAVINVEVAVGDVIDPERLIADAEAALDRAKQQGRNRVERVDGYSGIVLRTGTPTPNP